MPDAAVKAVVTCAVVDWQIHVYLRDLDVPHYPITADVQQILVIFGSRLESLFREREVICDSWNQCAIVRQSRFFCLLQFCIIHIADSFFVSGLHYGLVLDGGEVAYDRVQADKQSN